MNFWKSSKKKYLYRNVFLTNNLLSWNTRHQAWLFFFSGFYFDDLFSLSLRSFLTNVLLLPSFFIFDKWFSYWTGFGFVKSYLKFFNNLFYFERFDIFFLLFSFIISIIFISFFFFILFFFLI